MGKWSVGELLRKAYTGLAIELASEAIGVASEVNQEKNTNVTQPPH